MSNKTLKIENNLTKTEKQLKMNRLIHTNKKHLIIYIVLTAILCCAGKAVAQEREMTDVALVSSGNQGGGNITTNTTWTIDGTVNLKGQIVVKNSATLTIKVKKDVTTNQIIRRRTKTDGTNFNGAMFKVEHGATLKVEKNNKDAQVELRGGASFSTSSDGRTSCTGHYGAGVIILAYGNLDLSDCQLLNVINTTVGAPDNTTVSGSGGAIECVNDPNETYQTIALTDVEIYGCKATKGSAICFWGSGSLGPDNHRTTLTRVKIYHCHSTDSDKAGTIRTYGDAKTQLTLDACDIYENKSNDRGGGVYWNAGGDSNALITIKGGTKIRNNTATNEGGGIFLTGGMDLQSATISGNTAKYGAGIYMDTYDGTVSTYNGQAFDFTMKTGVTISSNTATVMGGGVMLRIRKSADVGYNSSGNPVDVTFGFDMQGGSITGNEAPQGAGVAIDDDAPKQVKYSTVSGIYYRDVKIRGGSITNNTTSSGTSVKGGGVYIYKHYVSGNIQGTDLGEIPIAISAGVISGNKATFTSGTAGVNNGSGGGLYIQNTGSGNYQGTCKVTVSGSAQIYGNSSTFAGGGIYLNGGTFTMTGGHVGQNSSGTASANKSANGAGFYIDGGSCTIQGGNIVNNVASSNGGGFYVDPGASATTTINSSSGATKVNNNQAVNGGGAYIATGTLTVAGGSDTQINSNIASTSGGGVYVNGGTVSLTNATLSSNIATAGNGGGVYAANAVTVTSATLSGNKALDDTNGKGGGIYATATVNIGGTSSAPSSLTSNQARLGGGIYADNTSVTIGYANIGNTSVGNSATANGGGVYAAGTVTLNTGAAIQSNTASTNGGGVYVDNHTFTMNAGNIGGSSASYGNTATNGNGGGVYITGTNAKVEVKGGSISYNTAPSTFAGNGGGIYVNSTGADGTAISGGATVSNNTASQNGGGIYVVNGKVTLQGTSTSVLTSISNNTATNTNGGGVYLGGGQFILGGYSTIVGNKANNGNGGGVYVGGSATYRQQSDADYLSANAYTEVKQNTANNGAGLYMGGGTCYVSEGYIHDNDATTNGGGVYMSGGECRHSGGEIGRNYGTNGSTANTAVNGGGLYMDGGKYYSTGGYFNGNKASSKGGGIYMEGGECYFQGGHLGYNTTTMRNTAQYGGGLYMAGSAKAGAGKFEMTDSDSYFHGNQASADGGAIYMEDGECTISAGNIGDFHFHNSAVNGGGIYANGGTIKVTGGYLQYNEASQNGGGIYANDGTVEVNYATASAGSVRYNYAGLSGGGLYIASNGTLYLKGKATLSKNHVPYGSTGGGVYLLGTVQAGNSSSDVITVVDNYAANESDPTSYTPIPETRNNIYLPAPVDTQTTDVITIVTNGLDLTQSKVGFSVPGNFLPVIYCSSNTYLNNNQAAIINAVFEDSERYDARYFPSSPTYSPYYIYLAADTWVQQVTGQPAGYSESESESGTSVTISSEQGLAWLISKVNGLNGQTGDNQDDYSGKTIVLTEDLDMSDYAWVPIGMTGGTSPKAFKGTFDGGGHLIKGILCSYLGNNDAGTGQNLGLFGVVDGAVIHDVFLEESSISVVDNSVTTAINLGGLASSGSATIYNCTASSTMNSNNPHTVMGGLIGQLTSGTIHSSAAMPTLTGYTMGGIAGTNAGNIYNSFANPKFTHDGSSTEYVGGLVADNSGTIENCYVRFSQPSSLGSAKFGQLVGRTNNNNVTICYNPTTYASGISANLVAPNSGTVSSLEYGDVVAPYYYNHSNDNTLVSDNTKNLLDELNRWVISHPDYAPWKRTTAGDYSSDAGNINGDYPIHKLAGYTCNASANGVNLDYAKSLDNMLTRHTSNATVNLYENDETDKATGSGVVVYIDEDVSLLQTDDTKDIAAYTCQTLKSYTRGERWHYFSSSLSNSGIGFNYGTTAQVPFSWAENPCNVTFSTTDDQALFPSDVPNINKVDLYCFYEPEYHWLNLKRNSNSHWHMNAPTVPIAYIGNGTGGDGNETSLVPGKGYLVSIDQEQLVQNRGTLNNGDVTLHDVTKTDFNAWAGLLGYNLLGNPYQSYLDIEKFMDENNTALWGGAKDEASVHTYAVYDPETDCYLQYKRGVSRGARATTGLLNPHQGFLIRKTTTDSGTNTKVKFTNAMRSNNGTPSFREPQPAYPLVNVILTDSQGRNDLVVLELGRDVDEGVEKLRVGECSGRIGLALGSESYAILFRDETAEQQALRFEAEEEGEFTLRWETANAQFESLTLVDNIEGSTTDMLSRDSYSFEGNPDHYASRFRIVIGEYKGIEEPEVPEPVEGPTCSFAYQTGDQLVVEGEGTLEVVDMLGHVVMTERLSDGQSRVRVPQTAGVYLLRLTGKNGTRTQKIVTK